jgi:RHS repeat-associated protein
LLSMTGTQVNESRTYNAMGQLTQLTGIGVNIKYNYASAGANNGQIASQQDVLSGETISYQYDALKRLSSASSTQGWGQGFVYDGFGNLTGKNALSGNPPVGYFATDPATNRLIGGNYDANGNYNSAPAGYGYGNVYDVSNRMVQVFGSYGSASYEYDPANKRVYAAKVVNGNTTQEWYFYGIDGKKLGTYTMYVSGTTINWSLQASQVFFRGRLVAKVDGYGPHSLQEDVRGSVGRYYPYGEDRDNTANDTVKFATYTRDAVSGLDYAVNRYYAPGSGRFLRPDPKRKSAQRAIPHSWNRYLYVLGDPINGTDRKGLNRDVCDEEEDCCEEGEPCADEGGGGGGNGPGGTGCDESGCDFSRDYYTCDESGCRFSSDVVDAEAITALSALDPNCQTVFASTIAQPSPSVPGPQTLVGALNSSAGSTLYIDARTSGSLTLAQATGINFSSAQTVNGLLTSLSGSDPAQAGIAPATLTGTTNGQTVLYNIVILATSFFGLNQGQQDTLLLHELLHVTLGSHPDIASSLGITPADTSEQGWSGAIAAFLNGGCH